MKISRLLKNPLVTGTLLMTAAGVISRIIGFFYRIFLSRTIGAESLGIYQLMGPVFSMCFALTASSIQTAISKFVGDATGKCGGKSCGESKARLYLGLGLVLSCALSVLCGFVVHRNADWLASSVLGEARCAPLLVLLTYTLLPSCIHACINGYYYGKQKALVPSICQLVEQLARVGAVWLIWKVVTEQGETLSEWHAVAGLVIGEFFGLLVSLIALAMEPRLSRKDYLDMKESLGTMAFSLGAMVLPLTMNRVLLSASTSLENLLIPQKLQEFGYCAKDALSIYGILTGMTMSIILFPGVLTNSFSVLLLPSVSEARAAGRERLIHTAIRKAVVYGMLLGLVFTVLFLIGGSWIGNHLFHNALAGLYIRRLSFLCPLMYITSLLNSIMHGLGMPGRVLAINLFACLIRICMIFFVVPRAGIGAYLWSMVISQVFAAIACMVELRNQ
ncbi:MAG: oligosaccharide flippase family protein [Blautia sp.]|nr:oligosaccharide flippase family protein [Blautia sp.]